MAGTFYYILCVCSNFIITRMERHRTILRVLPGLFRRGRVDQAQTRREDLPHEAASAARPASVATAAVFNRCGADAPYREDVSQVQRPRRQGKLAGSMAAKVRLVSLPLSELFSRPNKVLLLLNDA